MGSFRFFKEGAAAVRIRERLNARFSLTIQICNPVESWLHGKAFNAVRAGAHRPAGEIMK
ncbi:hypothetical protein ASE37_04850 [Rhizobium sp. Root268]|nr:hypothetical protein ASC86_04850 [Rhizobium sp. Root1212]KRD38290.1 hypothetical protein ASE37_04850 [Rhizobium sp. Root268]